MRQKISDYLFRLFQKAHRRFAPEPSIGDLLDAAEARLLTPRTISSFPHCDQRILHRPGTCRYCDMNPEWQELRIAWGIAFSGEEPDNTQPIACPADLAVMMGRRGDYNTWGGNIAAP